MESKYYYILAIAVTCSNIMSLLILCMYREFVTSVQETESDENQCGSRVLNHTSEEATHIGYDRALPCVIKMMHVAMGYNLMQIPE